MKQAKAIKTIHELEDKLKKYVAWVFATQRLGEARAGEKATSLLRDNLELIKGTGYGTLLITTAVTVYVTIATGLLAGVADLISILVRLLIF